MTAASPEWRRAFIALWPDAPSRHALARSRPPAAPGVRPLHPADLHLTLAFLGDLDAATASALTAHLSGAAPPAMTLDTLHTERWPDERRPRVQVLCYAEAEALTRLHATVSAALRAVGVPIESRPYRPHVTLARLARASTLDVHGLPASSRFVRFALCHGTDSAPGEPRYHSIAEWTAA